MSQEYIQHEGDAFHGLTLSIPELWDKDWRSALDGSEGLDHEILVIQSRAVNLLKEFPTRRVTPESLAWLSLFSRTLGCLEGAQGALSRQAELALRTLARVAFELSLQLWATLSPPLRLIDIEKQGGRVSESAKEQSWAEVLDRLRIYTAWCLAADIAFIERISKPGYLREAFDPRPAQQLARELGDRRPFHDALMGEFEVLSDAEATRDKLQAEASLRARKERLTQWGSDTRLRPTLDRINGLVKKSRSGTVSLFTLFDESEESVAQHLRARGLTTAYASYLSGSLVIHGSSLERSLFFTNSAVWPRFAGLQDDLTPACNEIITWCNQSVMLLFVSRNRLPR